MPAEFYRIYNEVLAKSLKKDVKEENTTVSAGVAANAAPGLNNKDSYATGDSRRGKSLFDKMFKRIFPKGLLKPKEVK
jgi:hypothetical protein